MMDVGYDVAGACVVAWQTESGIPDLHTAAPFSRTWSFY
jgi:hypothetical protein